MRLLFYTDGKQEGQSQRKKKKKHKERKCICREKTYLIYYVKFYINVPACGYEDIKKQSNIF